MERTDALKEIISRIVEIAHPEKIILFGSGARDAMGPDSDFDLLIIKPAPVHRRHLAQAIYRRLVGVGHPVDLIVATPEDIDRYGQCPHLVYRWALDNGKVVYEAN